VGSVRRFFFRSFFIFTLFFLFMFGFAYRALSKVTGRVYYSEDRKKRNQEKRIKIEQQDGARFVEFTTEDGIKIAGLLIVRPNARRNLLLCHGYRGNKEQLGWFLKMFPEDNALLFDFRGHGESSGQLVTIGYFEQKDVSAAVEFLQNNIKTKNLPIVGLGISMGAASLVRAAAHGVVFEKLILDSTFANLWEHIGESFSWRTGLPRFPFSFFVSFLFRFLTGLKVDDHNPADLLTSVYCPVLIIHAKDDSMVPVQHAYQVYDRANEKKKLWIAPCCRHGYACKDCQEKYSQQVHEFLAESFV